MIDETSAEHTASEYERAGVNFKAAQTTVESIKPFAKKTQRPGVISTVGGFGGLFSLMGAGLLNADQDDVILVAGTDGVGTKLKLAFELNTHHTIGIDCVAMCVNDIITTGAQPLFFMDYIATGKLSPPQIEQIISGITEGCIQAHCALLGGETAEMPGFYPRGEYDVAGFSVGAMTPAQQLHPQEIAPGDQLIGIASSGIHSNGFSLVRQIINEHQLDLERVYAELHEHDTLGDILLEPTVIYVDALNAARQHTQVLGAAHITGGGLIENIPRVIPDTLGVALNEQAWDEPKIFSFLSGLANISRDEQRRVFNLGLGMVIVSRRADDIDQQCAAIKRDCGLNAWHIGEVIDTAGVHFH